MQTAITKLNFTNYIDPSYEGYVNNVENELLGHSGIQGRQNGEKNKPVTEEELRAYIMNMVETRVQSAIDKNQELHQPVSGMVVARKIRADADDKISQLTAFLADDEHKLFPLEEKKKSCTPDLQKRRTRKWVHAGIIVMTGSEFAFIYEAARNGSIPKLTAFVMALGLALAIGFGSHYAAGFILKGKTTLQRINRYCIVLIPAFIGFYFIGQLRASSYNSVININHSLNGEILSPSGEVSGWSITIISFLLFLVALLLSVRFHKSEEETERDQEYDKICKEIEEVKNSIEAKRNEIELTNRDANTRVVEALRRYEYALAVESRLLSIAKHSMEVYKENNLRHRTDGLCPVFFSYPPPFRFKLFFDKVKSDNSNNDNPKAA
jgi:hypothetical protein